MIQTLAQVRVAPYPGMLSVGKGRTARGSRRAMQGLGAGLGAVTPPPVVGERARLAQQSGSLASTGLMLSAAIVGGPAGAIIAAAAGAVVGLTALFTNLFSGCGPTCTQATRVVDQVEAEYLKPMLAEWNAAPVHTRSMQAAMLQVFDYAWSQVVAGCSNPALGEAGRRCISERQKGGIVPGTNGNWWIWYRDPIANATDIVEDSVPTGGEAGAGAGSSVGAPSGSFDIPMPLLIAGGLLALLLAVK